MRQFLLSFFFFSIGFSTFSQAMDLSRDKLCAGGRIDREILMDELFEKIPLLKINAVITSETMQEMLLNPGKYCKSPQCIEKYFESLYNAYGQLKNFWDRHGGSPSSPQTLREFLQGKREPQGFCIQSASAAPTIPAPKLPSFAENIRIRKKADDLSVDQKDKEGRFKPLERATVNASRDYIKAVDAYDINGVVGYKITVDLERSWFELIPYLSYTRQHTARKKVGDNNEVEDFGGGLIASFSPFVLGRYHSLDLYPQVIHSTRTEATILSGNATFTPNLFDFGLGRPLPIPGLDWLNYSITAKLKASYANLLEPGDGTVLREATDHFRYGPSLSYWIGITQGSLKGMSLTLTYDYLDLVKGPPTLSHIAQFTATAAFAFPDQEFWSLNLTYVDGRDLNTFEKQRMITLGVGLKY